MTPGEELAAVLAPELDGWNVYGSLTGQVHAPAVVIAPDDPWIQHGPALGLWTEQWQAVAVVPAADPASGTRELHAVLLEVIDLLTDGWSVRDVSAPFPDEQTGVPILAAAARLSYAAG